MATKGKKQPRSGAIRTAGLPRPWSEFLGVALLAAGALIFGGLISYQGGGGTLMGPVGQLAAAALYAAFGMAAYLVAVGVIGMGINALRGQGMELGLGEGVGFAVATLAGCVLLHVLFPTYRVHGYTAGGLLGELVGEVCLGMFHHAGTYLIALAVMCLGLLASTPLSTDHLMRAARVVGHGLSGVGMYLWAGVTDLVRAQREAADEEEEDSEVQRRRKDAQVEAAFEAADLDGVELDEEVVEEEPEDGFEDDAAEDDVAEDEEDDAQAPAKPKAKSKGKGKARAAVAAALTRGAKNRKRDGKARKVTGNRKRPRGATRDEDFEDEALDDEDEADALADEGADGDAEALAAEANANAAAATRSSGARRGKKTAKADAKPPAAAEELPEIVMMDPADKVPPPEGGEASGPAASPSGKKAPPRPEQLAQATAAAAAATATAAAASSKPAGPKKTGGLVRLTDGPWQRPPLRLFESATEKVESEVDRGFVLEQAQRLVTALGEFKIKGKVTKIHPGPVITRYEFKPEPGTKLSRIESLENDLAMALEAIRIRILAPIPGKATVGFEVPNKHRETVYIKEILGLDNFGAKKKLPLALGKDITGTITVTDLAKAPHLLVAGATGSGKSVGVNSMICSLLYTSGPEDVRMIMIDPKMLELSIYEGIPHLLLPVVTDPEKAALALRWAVQEMERRYQLLSTAQVRDIAGYNKKLPELTLAWEQDKRDAELMAAEAAKDAMADGEDGAVGSELPGVRIDAQGNRTEVMGDIEVPEAPQRLPYIVVIIDEFADLMMVASKEVEQCVARIAAKARAAGIHLIVATQRPSVDVITGTIKNNFPSRIAFQVTSDADSRTILDGKGAKQLLGMGDMLHMDRGSEVDRVHGCFVSEDEILEVVKFVKRQAKPVYNMDIVRKQDEDDDGPPSADNNDPLYDKGVQIVADAQKVSTSMLQRRLGVGYNRAAKIVEAMEMQGVIGPSRGTTPREVYVSAAG